MSEFIIIVTKGQVAEHGSKCGWNVYGRSESESLCPIP